MRDDEVLGARLTLSVSTLVIAPEDTARFELTVENRSSDYLLYDSNISMIYMPGEWDQICPNARAAVVVPATIDPHSSITITARYPSSEDGASDCRVGPGAHRLVGHFRGCRSNQPATSSGVSCDHGARIVEAELTINQR